MTNLIETPTPQPVGEQLPRIYQPPRILHRRLLKAFSGSPLAVDPNSPDALSLPQ